MIALIRRNLKKEALQVIVWVTLISLVFSFSIPEMIRRFSGHDGAVSVNGYSVPMRDYVMRVQEEQERINSIRSRFGQHAQMIMQALGMQSDPKVMAMTGLIQDALLDQAADKLNLCLADSHIARELADPRFLIQEVGHLIPPYLIGASGGVNVPAVQEFLAKRGMTEYFERLVEGRLRRALLLEIVGNTMYVPRFQLRAEYEAQYLAKKFAIATFDLEAFVAEQKRTEISEKEARAFYDEQNAQSKRYWVPARRSGTYWKFSPRAYGITVTEQEIEEAYNRSKQTKFREKGAQVDVRRILLTTENGFQDAVQKAEEIKRELDTNPSRFAELARQHSQDKATASAGGSTGFFEKGTRDESFERVAFTLKDDGAISAPFQTPDGIEIIQRVAKKAAVFKPLSAVHRDLEQTLMEQKFKRTFTREAEKAIHGSAQERQAFIREHRGVEGSTGLVAKEESDLGAQLFKLRKAKEGDTPVSAFMDGTTGILLQLNEAEEAHAQKFADIKTGVIADVREAQARQALQAAVEQVATKARAGEGLAAAAKGVSGVKIEQTDLLKAENSPELEALNKRGLPVHKMFQLEKTGAVATQVGLQNGYVVQVVSTEKFNEADFVGKQSEIRLKMRNEQKALYDGAFIASLYRGAKIVPNKSIVQQS